MNLSVNITKITEADFKPQDVDTTPDVFLQVYSMNDASGINVDDIVKVVLYTGLTTFICLLGIPANILNCLVFRRQGLHYRMILCLFLLSVVDCLYLICVFTIFSVSSFIWFHDKSLSEEYYAKSFVSIGCFLNGLRLTSGCINVLIAVERCVCVVYPLHASNIMENRTVGVFVSLSFLLFHGCYLVLPFSFHAKLVRIGDEMEWLHVPTTFFIENMTVVYTFLYTVMGTIVPLCMFLIICIATSITVFKLRTAVTWREKTRSTPLEGQGQRRELTSLTSMLVAVSLIYVITMAPFVARQASLWFMFDCVASGHCYVTYTIISAVAYAVSHVNSSVHVFIYCWRSSRFRSALRVVCASHRQPLVTEGFSTQDL